MLGCGADARMNTPGKASGNWSWRYKSDDLTSEIAKRLKELTILYGRKEVKVKETKVDKETDEETDGKVILND